MNAHGMVMAVLAVAAAVLSFALWRILRRSREQAMTVRNQQIGELSDSVKTLMESVKEMDARLAEAEDQSRTAAAIPGNGINVTPRAKALRLHRMGKSPEQIAEQLNIPAGEARFLLKIHQLSMDKLLESPDAATVDGERRY